MGGGVLVWSSHGLVSHDKGKATKGEGRGARLVKQVVVEVLNGHVDVLWWKRGDRGEILPFNAFASAFCECLVFGTATVEFDETIDAGELIRVLQWYTRNAR